MKRFRRPLEGKTILIVEDDFLVGHDLRAFLEDAGATIRGPIADLTEACTAARQEKLAGALLDVRLWEATAAPVAVEITSREIPFIVVSGYAQQEVPPAMRHAAYLEKPVVRLDLVQLASALFH
jgi:DNA-binding NtrC family response regulator